MSADVSCRIAWADDAPAIAAVQVRSWRASYADLLPADLLAGLDAADLAQGWRASLSKPADARNRVLVALERNLVCGFTVTGPGLGDGVTADGVEGSWWAQRDSNP